jgi:hypothetical protein
MNRTDTSQTDGTRDAVSSAITRARSKGGKTGTLYKPATVKRLLKCVRDGLNLKQAAVACGIGESTLHEWKREHPEFLQRLEETREQARQLALETIWNARGDDWRAAEAFLKYSFHQDYRSGNQVNLKQEMNVAVATPKTLTEEERMKLIEQRERQAALQDKPVIEAQVIPEPEQQQPSQEPNPEAFNQPPPGWEQAREQRAQEAARAEKEAAEQKERDRKQRHDSVSWKQLFGSDD